MDNASYISTCRGLSCCVILIVLVSVHRPDGVSQGWSRDRRLDICKPTAATAAAAIHRCIEIALHIMRQAQIFMYIAFIIFYNFKQNTKLCM